jgi:hypothetical protein
MLTDGRNDKNRIGDDFCEDAFGRDTLQNQKNTVRKEVFKNYFGSHLYEKLAFKLR